jgi:hypothetical protein
MESVPLSIKEDESSKKRGGTLMNHPPFDFIVHYSRSEPFLSVTSLSAEIRSSVINGLNEVNAWGLSRFTYPEYLPQRFQAEERIRRDFLKKGGRPQLSHPIYFFLGRCPRFEEDPRNRAYAINLSDLDSNVMSFTYGDSMLSLNEDNRSRSGLGYLNPLCKEVYHLDELSETIKSIDTGIISTGESVHLAVQLWAAPAKEIVKILDLSL